MILRILLTMVVFGGVLLAGGAECSRTTPEDDDAPLPEGLSAPDQGDMQALKQAGERYLALRTTSSAAVSRVALVQELNTATPGVVSAGLANDNYTIVLVFEDGSRAAINTMDGFGGSEAYDPQILQDKLTSASKLVRAEKTDATGASALVNSAAANPAGGDLLHTPASRKILFMSAASEELSGADVDLFESIETKLVFEHQWDPDDIVIKYNQATDDYATLRFGDFFNLDSYGVIVIVAQGLYMDVTRQIIPPDEPGEDEEIVELPGDTDPFNFGFKAIQQAAAASGRRPRFFIQVSTAGPLVREVTKQPGDGASDTDPFNFGFKPIIPLAKIDGVDVKLETARGRLLIVAHVNAVAGTVRPYYYMRDDLWKEHITQLPNSLVYLATPNGYADPDYTWPELSDDPESPDSDPFNFGFKWIRAASTLRPRSTGAALVFEGSGTGSLLAWTGAVDKQSALDAAGLIGLMAARDESDRETWNSGSIQRTASRPGLPNRTGTPPPSDDGEPFNFGFKAIRSGLLIAADDSANGYAQLALHTKQDNAYLYLPTWIEATVLKPLPEGMTQVRVNLEYTDEGMPAPDPDTITGDEDDPYAFEGLIPGREVTLTAEALDGGGALLSEYTRTFELRSGGNPVEVYFTRELSVTLSGSPDTSGNWGDRNDPDNPHSIYCNGGKIYVSKNGTKLSPNYISLTDRWSSYKYPSMRVVSHDGVNSFSGRNPAYPGDTITIEFLPDPNEGGVATLGPIFVHYWNDSTHEVVGMGSLSGREDDGSVSATVTLGE